MKKISHPARKKKKKIQSQNPNIRVKDFYQHTMCLDDKLQYQKNSVLQKRNHYCLYIQRGLLILALSGAVWWWRCVLFPSDTLNPAPYDCTRTVKHSGVLIHNISLWSVDLTPSLFLKTEILQQHTQQQRLQITCSQTAQKERTVEGMMLNNQGNLPLNVNCKHYMRRRRRTVFYWWFYVWFQHLLVCTSHRWPFL